MEREDRYSCPALPKNGQKRYTGKNTNMETTQTFQPKTFTATGLLVLGILSAYLFLPGIPEISGSVRSLLFGIVFLVLVPMAHVRFVLKRPLSSMGFSGSLRPGHILTAILAAVPALLVFASGLRLFDTEIPYSLPSVVRDSFPWFLFYEIVLLGSVTFIYEVFFRGLVMLSWFASFGVAAVLLQFLVLVTFLSVSGGFEWRNAPMMLAGLVAGFTAYRTRSIRYSWLTAWLTMMLADVLFLMID